MGMPFSEWAVASARTVFLKKKNKVKGKIGRHRFFND
jgi:hypothetical protein